MVIKPITAIITVILFFGCSNISPGLLVTDIILPYSTDFRDTMVGKKRLILDKHALKEPISGYGVTVEWSEDRLLAAARSAGITTISYIDEYTFSVLFGIYSRQRLIIYGE